MYWTVYEIATGRIDHAQWVPPPAPVDDTFAGDGFTQIESANQTVGDDAAASYISGTPPAVARRPAHTITIDKTTINADGVDAATIAGIPRGARVQFEDGQPGARIGRGPAGGIILITADRPATMRISVDPFPALEFTTTIVAGTGTGDDDEITEFKPRPRQ